MSEKAIWITVEEPVSRDEFESIQLMISETALSERYEIIVTSDAIDTIDLEELRELIGNE